VAATAKEDPQVYFERELLGYFVTQLTYVSSDTSIGRKAFKDLIVRLLQDIGGRCSLTILGDIFQEKKRTLGNKGEAILKGLHESNDVMPKKLTLFF